jgi:fructose/tagatose bisphosphate aldolase
MLPVSAAPILYARACEEHFAMPAFNVCNLERDHCVMLKVMRRKVHDNPEEISPLSLTAGRRHLV